MTDKYEMKQKIACLGFKAPIDTVPSFRFDNSFDLRGYDCLIVSWAEFFGELTETARHGGNPPRLTEIQWNEAEALLANTNCALNDALKRGGVVVTILSSIHFVATRGGQPRNISAFADHLPHALVERTVGIAGAVQPFELDGHPLAEFAKEASSLLTFSGGLADVQGIPIFRAPNSRTVVGIWIPGQRGGHLCCPVPPYGDSHLFGQFVSILDRHLPCFLVPESAQDLPDWHHDYRLASERRLLAGIEIDRAKSEQLQAKIEETERHIAVEQRLKRLFTENGQPLVDCVTEVLTEMGFSVTPGPEYRDDLIALGGTRDCVVEVKGRERRGAAEADAAQLEKWVSGYYETYEREPKGILILNAYKDIPLCDRTAPAFPDQMLDYVNRKQQCLISTTQLLCLFLDIRDGVASPDSIREQLIDHTGIFPRYLAQQDWLERIQR